MGKVPAVRQAINESYSFLRRYPHLRASMTLKDKLRVGCSGWGYDDRLGGFYPPDTPKSDYLKLYSSVMQEFLRALEVDKYPHAIEFRHKSWFRDDVYDFLRDRNVAMVWTENQYLKSPTDVTAEYVYLRMVGDREITEFKETQKDK